MKPCSQVLIGCLAIIRMNWHLGYLWWLPDLLTKPDTLCCLAVLMILKIRYALWSNVGEKVKLMYSVDYYRSDYSIMVFFLVGCEKGLAMRWVFKGLAGIPLCPVTVSGPVQKFLCSYIYIYRMSKDKREGVGWGQFTTFHNYSFQCLITTN